MKGWSVAYFVRPNGLEGSRVDLNDAKGFAEVLNGFDNVLVSTFLKALRGA